MPHVSGAEVLRLLTRDYPDIPVIIITGNDDLDTAIRCMQDGAFDYMVKPIVCERLVSGVKRALEMRELRRENQELTRHVLSSALTHPEAFAEFDVVSQQMLALFRYVESIAGSASPTLITGETGVGKELMARAIHQLSRPQGPFVPINLAGLDETTFADTLFGHRKGAFTGAIESRGGVIEQAENGVLFLDEIGELNMNMQIKLLRLLQEREYRPLGSDVARRSTARVIVATNRDIAVLMDATRVRPDLFYRLRHHHVHIPPLRERRNDVPCLVNRLLTTSCARLNKKRPAVTPELLPLLETYDFPGNVRELAAMIHDAVSQHKGGRLGLNVFKKWITTSNAATPKSAANSTAAAHSGEHAGEESALIFNQIPTLKAAQAQIIAAALRRAQGNQALAAKLLGITRQALNRRMGRKKRDG